MSSTSANCFLLSLCNRSSGSSYRTRLAMTRQAMLSSGLITLCKSDTVTVPRPPSDFLLPFGKDESWTSA